MTLNVLAGDLRTGRIRATIPVRGVQWKDILNDSGSVDQVSIADDIVRRLALRRTLPAARSFLAFEDGDRIRQAGPIWSRQWNWQSATLTLGAGGLWSLFDYRKVLPVLTAGMRVQDQTTTVSNVDLPGLARALVAQALAHTGGNLPLVLPSATTGTNTETFPGWRLYWLGGQLREITQRQVAAPDIEFAPRRQAADRRFIEWVMRVGTAAAPLLSQTGSDWQFDATARKSPLVGITTDEDARVMGTRAFEIGNGTEVGTLMSWLEDPALPALGWPLLEVEETRSNIEVQATLDGYAAGLLDRSARPAELFKVTVRRDAVAEVHPGDYARVRTKGDAWLGDMDKRMRIRQISGDLSDDVVLDMYPLAADL